LNAALIANEGIDYCIKSGNSGILCKLDIENAYDHRPRLLEFSFGDSWKNEVS